MGEKEAAPQEAHEEKPDRKRSAADLVTERRKHALALMDRRLGRFSASIGDVEDKQTEGTPVEEIDPKKALAERVKKIRALKARHGKL